MKKESHQNYGTEKPKKNKKNSITFNARKGKLAIVYEWTAISLLTKISNVA